MADPFIDIKKPTIDLATVMGVFGSAGLLITAIFIGGAPLAFINTPSLLIVVGGTLLLTTACHRLEDMVASVRLIGIPFSNRVFDPAQAATICIQTSDHLRRAGVRGFQSIVDNLEDESVVHAGLTMVIDGNEPAHIGNMLKTQINFITQRHRTAAGILRKMAEFSPAMGLIGTLVGLVQMLSNLDDPQSIGPGMAVALITTFYGAVLANMVFLPLAYKLERIAAQELLVNTIYYTGVLSIANQENPRRLEFSINSLLPKSIQVNFFD